ncbi:piggyBac transposable element-derived protein 4-like [Athalia rosae]|uniref:piggyBac transposable element-derived protein 4-like n=1 Tax=Athalia rosae TaxID=37344 RepID=UPI00203351EE|nr:piggyBac transposable element-derived protein 4-like [Athalia rosae]
MDMEISDSDESIITSRRKAARLRILSSSSDEDFVNVINEENECSTEEEDLISESENEDHEEEWQEVKERTVVINEYSEEEEFLHENIDCNDPFALYKLEKIVDETNKYATQSINNSSSSSRIHQQDWQSVTRDEMNTFFGILLIMGIVQLPEIRLYWSNNDMYANARIKKAMRRDHFLSILKFLHFSDNTTARTEDRLHKIRNIIEAIVDNFKSSIKPGKNIVIDESMVPWRGRLGFRQYIPGKRHKYGVKAYKLCLPEGYTYNFEIYAGKNGTIIKKSHSHDVVMRLLSDLGKLLSITFCPMNKHVVIYRHINTFFNHMKDRQETPVNAARNAIKICPIKRAELVQLTILKELRHIVGFVRDSQHFA